MNATMLIALFLMPPAPVKTTWYGGATASFNLKTTGNPFDSEQNDIRVSFKTPSGKTTSRLAYFAKGKWHVNLASTEKGKFTGTVTQNGKATSTKVSLTLSKSLTKGFIRKTPEQQFVFDNGTHYWPMGFNFGWRSDNIPDIPEALKGMKANGVNWTRIWSNHWDDKNPTWVKGNPAQFSESALNRWQTITDAAQKGDVNFQFVLFHHGPWSTRVNSNWPENPWSKAQGGFLENPTEFFTSPRAKKIAKAWLRYAVARYGDSPAIMSWELFNEVEWVDPNYDQKEQLVGDWHKEMATYIRSIDPYKHLVTTSSRMTLPIYDAMDYYQPHGYPNRIQNLLLASPPKGDKPYFYGEVGTANSQSGPVLQRQAIRDAIYTALIMGHSGAAQYWYWDLVYPQHSIDEYAFANKILTTTGILNQKVAKFNPSITAPAADLVIQPAGDWEAVTKFNFNLPEQAAELGGISSFFQGTGHPEMRSETIKLHLTNEKASTLTIRIGEVSGGGGSLFAKINGKEIARVTFAPNEKPGDKALKIPLPIGKVTVELDNDGPDWLRIQSISIPGAGSAASAFATGNKQTALLRVEKQANTEPFQTTIARLPLANGVYKLTNYDLDKKVATSQTIEVQNGKTTNRITVDQNDSILTFTKK
jgi:hypothetical protein